MAALFYCFLFFLADQALIGYCKIIAEINRNKYVMRYRNEPKLTDHGKQEFKVCFYFDVLDIIDVVVSMLIGLGYNSHYVFLLLILDISLSLPYLGAHGVWHARWLGHRRRCRFSAESRCNLFISTCEHGCKVRDSLQTVQRAAAGLTGVLELECRCISLFLKVIFD